MNTILHRQCSARSRMLLVACSALLLLAVGCQPPPEAPPQAAANSEPEAPTNRTPVPPVVRRNLGITFANAEYRAVTSTVALPGYFEVLPSAQHHYPVPVGGRVAVHVRPLEEVEAGQLLLEIDAPDWRALQLELVEAQALRLTGDAKVVQARAARLAAGSLTQSEPAFPDVFAAEILAAEAAVEAADDRLDQLVSKASTLTGLSAEHLREVEDGLPRWRRLAHIPIRATRGGIVREVDSATGTWVSEGTEIVHVVHPDTLRFRARALQADLIDHLRDGQIAEIRPPEGRGEARRADPVIGTVRIGVTGDPDRRTTDLFIDFEATSPWVRPQVVGLAEVIVAGSSEPTELAIPTRAVIRDGLEHVFFRRDPGDPDQVIRVLADLGPSDGRWTTILSGLAEGDEVVVDGVYQLKLATTGQKVATGHFHADGTFHEEDD